MRKDIQEIRGKGKGSMVTGGPIGLWGIALRIWVSDGWMDGLIALMGLNRIIEHIHLSESL